MEGRSTSCRVRATVSGGQSTACQRPSRPYHYAAIIASALFLVSCGSAKTAARAEVKRQATQDTRTGVSLEVTTKESAPVVESPELYLQPDAIEGLPEGAEFSRSEGSTRVSVRKERGGSLTVRATGIRQQPTGISVKAGAAAAAASADSTAASSGSTLSRKARDGLGGTDKPLEILTCIVVLSLAGLLIYKKFNK